MSCQLFGIIETIGGVIKLGLLLGTSITFYVLAAESKYFRMQAIAFEWILTSE
jgi:hypothetical protein